MTFLIAILFAGAVALWWSAERRACRLARALRIAEDASEQQAARAVKHGGRIGAAEWWAGN